MTARKLFAALARDEKATSAVEMGLICAMIVLAMFAALQGFSGENSRTWETISRKTREAINKGTNNDNTT